MGWCPACSYVSMIGRLVHPWRQVTRTVDGKTYALKKVDVSSLDDKELVSALNEIRLLASFSHPRIVRLYETFMGELIRGLYPIPLAFIALREPCASH